MANKKFSKLTRRTSGLMALEQRFMFDGAAADTAADAVTKPDSKAIVPSAVVQAEKAAQQKAAEFLNKASDQELFSLFNGGRQTADAAWTERLSQIRDVLNQGESPVQMLMMDQASQFTAVAAFAANGPNGKPTIFVNPYWMGLLDNQDIADVLVEELGHWMDNVLNPEQDTAGDEGQVFASRVNGYDTTFSNISQSDAGWVVLDGKAYAAEFASYTFATAYQIVVDINNSTTVNLTTGLDSRQALNSGVSVSPDQTFEYAIDKESNNHNFIYTANGLGSVAINDGAGGVNFSGNDVSAIGLNIAGTDYYGWISRPIKVGGQVKGFYFWTDVNFTNLAAAQADGNQDSDASVLDNRGFVLVVDKAYFDSTLGFISRAGVQANTYKVIGSSSDRVDSALNSLLPVNVAPVANTDTSNVSLAAGASGGPALEAGGLNNATVGANAIGNVLSNDTDANSDTLKVTFVGTSSAATSVATSSTSASNGTTITGLYGTLTLGADGSYLYAINNSNSSVQALRLSTNTLTDSFTYSIADPSGLSSSAKINIIIQGANDTPVAANDYNTAKESLLADTDTNQYTTADPLGYKATGNVLTNDTDIDANSETKAISGISISGSATGTTSGAGSSVTKLSFNSLPGNVSVGYYVFLDGDNTANNSAGTLTALKNSSNTQLTVATIDSTTKTFTLSGAVSNVALSSSSILGFANKANGTGAYKDSAISTTPTTTSTTNVSLSGTITGTIAVGMTETSTGAQVSQVTYDSATGKATAITLQGTFTFTGQALNFTGSASASQSLTGQYGVLQLNADGTYDYTPTANNSAIGTGQSYTDAFNYTMKDALNATSSATLFITVQGSSASDPNAVPDTATAVEAGGISNGTAGTNPTGNLMTNDTTPNGTGSKVLTSAASLGAASATAVTTNTAITGLYGTLTLSSDGSYAYTVNNNNTSVQALHGSSNTLTDVFRYTIRNGTQVNSAYLTDTSTVTFTIQGANDNPVASNDTASAIEASGYLNGTPGYNPSGNVLDNDSDVDDANSALRVTAVRTGSTEGSGTAGTVGSALSGQYGSLTLNANGSWTYTVNNDNATVNALTSGQTLTDNFNYTVMDSSGVSGLTDIAVLAITIQGADDTLSVNSVFVNEASPYAVFTVSGANGMPVQLSLGNTVGVGALNSNDRLATLGTDTLATNNLQYLNGSTWLTYDPSNPPVMPSGNQLLVRIGVNQDAVHEGNESFTLTASSGSQTAVGIGTINDEGEGDLYPNNTTGNKDTTTAKDDDRPLIAIGDASVVEGGVLEFTASLSNASAYPINFTPTLAAVAGTATVGTDTSAANTLEVSYDNGANWATVSGPVTFAAGQTSMKFRLTTVDDATTESAENLYLSTSYINGSVKSSADVSGQGIIIDNDGPPSFSINDTSVNEGAGTITFTVTRSGDSSAIGTVSYAVATGTAGTADYSASNTSALSGTLSFAAGETSKTIVLNITNDNVYEGTEEFYVNLTNPTGSAGATIADTQGVGTITDDGTGNGGADDDRPVLTVVGVDDVSEGSYSVFTVSLNKPLAASTDIKLLLGDGSALLSSDLNSSTMQVVTNLSTALGAGTSVTNGGNYTLSANTQTFYVRVLTKTDTPYEGAENFTLTASFVSTALLYADRTGTVTTLRTGATADDASTILDDGSGTVYDGLGGNSGVPDDDRVLTVTSYGPVNEGSTYAMFKVDGTPGYTMDLALQAASSGTAATTSGFTFQFSTDGGTTWATYDASNKPTVPAGGSFFVRVNITTESDTTFEGAETFALKASYSGNTAKSAAADATIIDDGTGTKYDGTLNGGSPTISTTGLDDDQPKPIIRPAPPAPPLPPAPVAPEPTPAPPVVLPKPFNSFVQPLAAKLAQPAELPPAPIEGVLTSNSGFPIVAIENAPPGLSLNKGVTDQFVEQNSNSAKFTIPYDAFMHSKQDAVIKLQAKQADDAPLPVWVKFDPQSGTFEANPPPNFKGKIELKVIARDDDGREATSIFRLFVGDDSTDKPKPQSRNSLSDKIRLAAKRPAAMPVLIKVTEPVAKPSPMAEAAIAG